MADGIQVPTAKELGINQHFHKAGFASKVATTKDEADSLKSEGWSDKPESWIVYGPKGDQVTVWSAQQEADALAQGYSLEPPVQVEAVTLKQRTPMQQSQESRKKADA